MSSADHRAGARSARESDLLLPPGYAAVRRGRTLLVACEPLLDTVAGILAAHRSLQGWAAARPGAKPLVGRGTVWAVAAPDVAGSPAGEGAGGESRPARWVVRHYRRGGGMRWLGDRYLRLGALRPLRELRASAAARARGVRTPSVVALSVRTAGIWYRADLVTQELPDVLDLAGALWAEHPGAGDAEARLRALAAAGGLLRELAAAGVDHPDLNAKNIVLESGPPGRAYVLDLDGCRVAEPLGPGARSRARARLERSLHKWERRTGRSLAAAEWRALRAAVGGRDDA